MKKLTRFLFAAAVASNPCLASDYYEGKVRLVGASPVSNTVIVYTENDLPGATCTYKNQLKWDVNADSSNAIMALALSAYHTGKRVRISYDLESDCLGGALKGGFMRFDD